MDAVFYKFIDPGTPVCFIRSSVEEPFLWSMFEGIVAHAYDINKRFYYQCTLTNVCADAEWIAEHVANKTFRMSAIDDGHQENAYLYHDGIKPFMEDWKMWWHSKWLFDLTADIVFAGATMHDAKCKAYEALSIIYQNNINRFKAQMLSYQLQLASLKQTL